MGKLFFVVCAVLFLGGCGPRQYEYHGSCTGQFEIMILGAMPVDDKAQATLSVHINERDREVTFNNGTFPPENVTFSKYQVSAIVGAPSSKVLAPGEENTVVIFTFDKQTKVVSFEKNINRGIVKGQKYQNFFTKHSFVGSCKE